MNAADGEKLTNLNGREVRMMVAVSAGAESNRLSEIFVCNIMTCNKWKLGNQFVSTMS